MATVCLLCLRPIESGDQVDVSVEFSEPDAPRLARRSRKRFLEAKRARWRGGFTAAVHVGCEDWIGERWHVAIGCECHDDRHLHRPWSEPPPNVVPSSVSPPPSPTARPE